MSTLSQDDRWNPSLYENQHGFVHKLGAGVFELLNPKPGESILDVGCGTGSLTQKIADSGANVLGIDASPAMIAEAKKRFANLNLQVMDATTMHFAEPFDAIFSNAALHWIKPPVAAAARMYESLKPGGRLVVEFGGKGNVQNVLDAAAMAGPEIGINVDAQLYINYFPAIGEYATLLEQQGFEVTLAQLFDRPTPLEGEAGLRNWIHMFRSGIIESVPPANLNRFFEAMERIAHPALFQNGTWSADYRRLRIVAHRPAGS